MTMGPILTKEQMTEEDIKLQFITPAIIARWPREHITMEQKITDGKINLKGNLVVREKPKKADYVLYLQANLPIAIVEAKDNNHSVSYGLQQAMTYSSHGLVARSFCCMHSKRKARKRPTQNFAERNANTKTG